MRYVPFLDNLMIKTGWKPMIPQLLSAYVVRQGSGINPLGQAQGLIPWRMQSSLHKRSGNQGLSPIFHPPRFLVHPAPCAGMIRPHTTGRRKN